MKKLTIAVFVLGFIAAGIGLYMYNKPHEDISKQKPDFEITAQNLFNEFEENEETANEKYLDKVIKVTGEIAGLNNSEEGGFTISLLDEMFGVTCVVSPEKYSKNQAFYEALETGKSISLKGKCDGMLTDVRISKCSQAE